MFSIYLYAFKNKMAKKHSKTEAKTGMIYRCGNCDAMCDDETRMSSYQMVMGRQSNKKVTRFCDRMCLNKYARDELRGDYVKDIKLMETAVELLTMYLRLCVEMGRESKTAFEAVKMTKQQKKVKEMMLGGTHPQHIVAVELFKLSETAMTFAELIADEEDKLFIEWIKMKGGGDYTQIEAYNLATWARNYSNDEASCLSIWFD